MGTRLLYLRFVDGFAAEVLGGQFQKQSGFGKVLELVVDICFVMGELMAELCGDLDDSFGVLDDPDRAEYDDALKVQRPMIEGGSSVVHDAKGGFVAPLEGIQPMPYLTAMKIDLTILFVIVVVHRCAVGVAVITVDRKDPSFFASEDLETFGVG